MSCFAQGNRYIEFSYNSTPKNVGPGKYLFSQDKSLNSTLAPFMTSSTREAHFDSQCPGPGAYSPNTLRTKALPQDHRSPAFKSQLDRFNTSHEKKDKFQSRLDSNFTGRSSPQNRKLNLILLRQKSKQYKRNKRTNTASIPPARKLAPKGFTGIKEDKVGPADYSPSLLSVKNSTMKGPPNFGLSQVKRNPFHNLNQTLPGPGYYFAPTEESNEETPLPAATVGLPCFVSKVPKFKVSKQVKDMERIGPGSYNSDTPFRIKTGKESLNKSWILNNDKRMAGSGRTSPPVDNLVPGPGTYDIEKISKQTENNSVQPQSVPFNSTQERSCISKIEKRSEPGPGTYIDVTSPIYSSVCQGLLKYAVDRGIMLAHGVATGPFGTTERRFEKNYFKPKDGPGPGEYAAKNPCGAASEKQTRPGTQVNKIGFSTLTERFFKPPKVSQMRFSIGPKTLCGPPPDLRQFPKQAENRVLFAWPGSDPIGFESTNPRFEYQKSKKPENSSTPGPGSYFDSRPSVKYGTLNQFNQTERKFKGKISNYLSITSTGPEVGPGAYTPKESMIKKSFNIRSYLA